MIASVLESIGLTKSEIKVYTALLELGSSTTGPIVEKAGVTSSKIYEILDRLMQKGLVSYALKGKTKYYEAASPERIGDYLNEKKATLDEQESEIRKIIPELKLKQQLSKYKQEALIFKGQRGAETAFLDILATMKKGEEYYVFVITELTAASQRWMMKFHAMRAKAGIKVKFLVNENARKLGEERAKFGCTEIKYVQPALATPAVFNVYADKTLISIGSTEEYINILIKSKELADSCRAYFEVLWNSNVKVYEDFAGVQQIFWNMIDTMKKGEEYFVIGANYGGEKIPGIRQFFADMHRQRISKGIRVNLLWNYEYKDDVSEFVKVLSRIGFLPPGLSSPMEILVYYDNVFIMVWKEPGCTAFGIQNKAIADSFRQYWNSMWKLKAE